MLSRLLYNTGTRRFNEKEVTRMGAVYMKAVRDICQCRNLASSEHVSDLDALKKVDMPSFRVLLVSERLMFFCRLLRTDLRMALFLAGISAKDSSSWIGCVFDDLRWLKLVLPTKLEAMPSPHSSPVDWVQSVAGNPVSWTKLFASISLSAKYNAEAAKRSSGQVQVDNEEYVCEQCSRTFATMTQWRSHMHRVHGVKNAARAFVDETNTCFACLRQYVSRDACVQHFRHRPDCLRTVKSVLVPLDDGRVSELDALALVQEAKRTSEKRPVKKSVLLHGPLLSPDAVA